MRKKHDKHNREQNTGGGDGKTQQQNKPTTIDTKHGGNTNEHNKQTNTHQQGETLNNIGRFRLFKYKTII